MLDIKKYPMLKNKFDQLDSEIGILQRIGVFIDQFPRIAPETDDTARIGRAVAHAKANGYKKVLLTDASYEVSGTTKLSTENEKLGVVLEGVLPESVEIIANMTGTTPVFTFEKIANNVEGWSERWSNAGLKNLRIRPKTVSSNRTGTAIYVRGACFNQFENVRITNMKYGIHLHNEGVGTYTEVNLFRNFRIDFCDNAIRMERGTGDESFHGNVFDKVYINVKTNQIGINLVSGYWYNGRFDIFMWAQKNDDGTLPTGTARPILISADGTARNLTGTLTVEAYGEPRLTGTGYFWWHGTIDGIGGNGQPKVFVDETTVKATGERVFSCDNHFTTKQLGTYDMYTEPVLPLNQRLNRGTLSGSLMRLTKSANADGTGDRWLDSLVALARDGSPSNNGLYVGSVPNNADEASALLGFFLSQNGQFLRSYKDTGLEVIHRNGANDYSCGKFAYGFFNGQVGKWKTQAVTANAGVQQTFTMNGYNDSNIFFNFSLRIYGTNFEFRQLYRANKPHSSQGDVTLTPVSGSTEFYNLAKTGVTIDAVKVRSADGYITVALTTDIPLTIEFRASGVGML